MKENDQRPSSAANGRAPTVEFLLFLLEPEDTGATASSGGSRSRYRRFDNRLGGAAKILFWLGATVLFWGGFCDLCALVAAVLERG